MKNALECVVKLDSITQVIPTDHDAAERQERFVHVVEAFVSDGEPAIPMQPGERPFHDPAGPAQAAAVRTVAAGEQRADAPGAQLVAVPLGVIPAVTLHDGHVADRPARLAPHAGHRVDEREQLRNVRPIGGRQVRDERNAGRVGEEVVFTPQLYGDRLGSVQFRPAQRADRRTVDHPPHEVSLVAPAQFGEQPFVDPLPDPGLLPGHKAAPADGARAAPHFPWSMFQGMPLRRTKRMPVSTARSGIGLRPAYRRWREGRAGKTGSIRAHRASSSKGVVMRDRLPASHAKVPRCDQQYKS